MLVEKYGWAIQKSLFAETNQDPTFSQNILALLTINYLQAESHI